MTDSTDVGGGTGISPADRDARAAYYKTTGELPDNGYVDGSGNLRASDGTLIAISAASYPGAAPQPPQTGDGLNVLLQPTGFPPEPRPRPDQEASSLLPGLLGQLKLSLGVPSWVWLALAAGAVLLVMRGKHGRWAA